MNGEQFAEKTTTPRLNLPASIIAAWRRNENYFLAPADLFLYASIYQGN